MIYIEVACIDMLLYLYYLSNTRVGAGKAEAERYKTYLARASRTRQARRNMDNSGKKEKKRMSPKAKKIANIIVTSLQVAIVVVTVVISIFVWTTTGNGEATAKRVQLLAIRSNSMKGDARDSFNAGDLVIVKAPEDATALEIGTVITYKYSVTGGGTTLITHRIVEIIPPTEEGGNVRYRTQGDNAEDPDSRSVQPGDVVGIYAGKIKGVGTALLWLQGFERVELSGGDYGWDYVGNSNNFLYVIIIPLIALLLWNGYAMIKVIMEGKLKKARDEAAAAAAAAAAGNAAALDAEEIKRRAIEEYLASLSANKATVPEAPEAPAVVAQPEPAAVKSESTVISEVPAVEVRPEQNSPLEKGGLILSEETGSPQNTSFVGKGETEQSGASDAQAAASGERQSRRNGGFDKQPAEEAIKAPAKKPASKAAPKTPAKQATAKTTAKAPAKKPKSE